MCPSRKVVKRTMEEAAYQVVAVARAGDRVNPDTHHICTAHFVAKCLLCHGKYNNQDKYWCILSV